jgi:hypothetical protein
MENKLSKIPELPIGVDLGDKYTFFCVLVKSGYKIEEGRIRTTKEAFGRKFTGLGPGPVASLTPDPCFMRTSPPPVAPLHAKVKERYVFN